jgi:ribulose kinase
MKQELFLGIDVGSGSARAGFFTAAGRSVGSASHPIKMWKPQPDFVEQSSEDIWAACCAATKQALKLAGIKAEQVAGIGFDATCSLVVLDSEDRPVSVSPTGNADQNVIVWMDHRAIPQAERINQTGRVIAPVKVSQYHERKYRIFHRLHADFLASRRIMAGGGNPPR